MVMKRRAFIAADEFGAIAAGLATGRTLWVFSDSSSRFSLSHSGKIVGPGSCRLRGRIIYASMKPSLIASVRGTNGILST